MTVVVGVVLDPLRSVLKTEESYLISVWSAPNTALMLKVFHCGIHTVIDFPPSVLTPKREKNSL